jgi:hypothetical protein
MKIENKCHEEFAAIKRGIKNGIFYLNGETLDVFNVSYKKETPTWESFTSNIPMDKCCLLFTHFDYISATDGVERSKFINILWSPAGASRKEKMTMSFFTEKALMSLGALGTCRIQAGSLDELEESIVKEKILRTVTVK